MRYLFVHQNFPGQFRHVAKALAEDPAHQVIGVGETANLKGRPPLHPRVRVLGYTAPEKSKPEGVHHYLRDHQDHVRRGQQVARLAMKLRDEARFAPDVVFAHPGWGEALFLRDVFPRTRHLQYFEYYYRADGGDLGFDKEFADSFDDVLRVRIKNGTQLHGLVACDAGLAPTVWQRSRYPAEFQPKIEVAHDGIDTDAVRPDAQASVEIDGERYAAGDEIVTYVARNLEPYRGFHVFLRALPKLLAARPNARVLIVGGDEVSYGRRLPVGQTYRQRYLDELGDALDRSRVRFVGKLPYARYLQVLQVSAAHVYLTYPFVLSWSMLEAMAAGCLLVASATAPVLEVVEHERNGLLVDFFDADALVRTVADALARPRPDLRAAARRTVTERYDLKTVCLPRWLQLLG